MSKKSADRQEIKIFIDFYLKSAVQLSKEVGYIALPDAAYELGLKRFEKRTVGSVFGGHGSQVGVKIEELLKKE